MTIAKCLVLKKPNKTSVTATALSLVLILILIALITNPDLCSKSFTNGLILFSTSVLPTLFPFLFITKMLTDFGFVQKITNATSKTFKLLFGTNGIALYIFSMSLLCGYPVGAKILSDLARKGKITKEEANQMLPFCTSSGPLFIIGTVGVQMFENKALGAKLFLIHFLATFFVAATMCNITRHKNKIHSQTKQTATKCTNLDQILSKSMTDTCLSVLSIGGFITIFYVLIDILTKFKILAPLTKLTSIFLGTIHANKSLSNGLSSGLFELTRGCKDLSISGAITAPVAISFLLGFGGLSIILQSASFLSKAKISIKKFLLTKTLQGIVAVLFALLII